MTKHTRRNDETVLQAPEPQAEGFSWSESQTGTSSLHDETRKRGRDGVEQTVTMLDYEGSPVVTVTEAPERQRREAKPGV